jgi:hypothetical protein
MKNYKIVLKVNNIVKIDSENSLDNPLIWPLLTLLRASQQSWKVHVLASELEIKGLLPDLDQDANKALFKRNFLLMNALYQLQDMLLPDHWLQIQAMDIQLLAQLPSNIAILLKQNDALRNYYLDWSHFDTSAEGIEALLNSFWGRYKHDLGKLEQIIDKTQALQIFALDERASNQDIRRQWRKLALKWHPDRTSGNVVKFRQVCEAWQILRAT